MSLIEKFSENEDEDYASELLDDYMLTGELGEGAFSSVFSAIDLKGRNVALKVVDKRLQNRSRETQILSQLNHPNVVKFISARESPRKFYLITELVEGITLERFMLTKHSEETIRQIIKQLLEAILYVHSMDVIHRDIKPENILVNQKTLSIKLIDFGLSFMSQSRLTHENCGTLIFMAPEMALKKEYFKSVDVWSVGVMQFMLFSCGVHPIWDQETDNKQTYLEKLTQNLDYKFPDDMSEAARNFFKKTVTPHPESRMSTAQALNHPWIKGSGELHQPITMADMVQQFKATQNLGNLFKLVVFCKYLVQNSIHTPQPKEFLKTVFQSESDCSPYSLLQETTSDTHCQGSFSQFIKNCKQRPANIQIRKSQSRHYADSDQQLSSPESFKIKLLRSSSTANIHSPEENQTEKIQPLQRQIKTPQIGNKGFGLGSKIDLKIRRTSLCEKTQNFEFGRLNEQDDSKQETPMRLSLPTKSQQKQFVLPPIAPVNKTPSPTNPKRRSLKKATKISLLNEQLERQILKESPSSNKRSFFSLYKS